MTDIVESLLPCPFCGAAARTDLLPHSGGPGWVQCSECECDQYMCDTIEEAIAKWNRRAPAQPALIDRLKNKADEQTTALDQIMTTAADNLASPGSDLKMTLEFIQHVAEHTLALTSAERGQS